LFSNLNDRSVAKVQVRIYHLKIPKPIRLHL
jgi:hypothetical protein